MTDADDTAAAANGDDTPEAPKGESVMFFETLQPTHEYYGAPDYMLQKFADFANSGTAKGMGVTLFLTGGMVSGSIESQQDYFHGLAEQYREAAVNSSVDGELPEGAEIFAQMVLDAEADRMNERTAIEREQFENDGTTNASEALTRYLHLGNAHFTVPGSPSFNYQHVRIQISHVAGWTLGLSSWG